ncbi:glycosyltransferase 87 family protein [Marinoscillum sp.]|uniref:glycosyltransferase 87 family protein n=1 Tax=Marinoscillum sp. TaxID=2024838 RepID=UPI003BAD1C88
MEQQNKTAVYTSIFVLFAGISAVGLLIPRHDSLPLGLAYSSAFFAYFWICQFPPSSTAVLSVGVLLRLLLFLGMPLLSDDVYRFIWDGQLLNEGLSPFEKLPADIAKSGVYPGGLSAELYQHLNSKEYFTIYPPVNQMLFWFSTWISGNSWLTAANIMRTVLLSADIGTFLLLRKLLTKLNHNPTLANWYFLNPLLIMEGVGNLHFEAIVSFFLVLGLLQWYRTRMGWSGLAIGMAVATKLLPLIYLPGLLLKSKLKHAILLTTAISSVIVFSFIILVDPHLIQSITSSLELYFQKFEFNASIYFLLREVGYWLVGYNVIGTLGPSLSIITFFTILLIAIIGKIKSWQMSTILMWSLTSYLLLATTVHPWYIIPLILLGILSGYWFPIIWSLFIFVSYFGYTNTGFELSSGWLVVEYVAVLSILAIEVYKKNHAKNT